MISEIRSLKAECELLLKVVEVIDEPRGPGDGRRERSLDREDAPLLYMA